MNQLHFTSAAAVEQVRQGGRPSISGWVTAADTIIVGMKPHNIGRVMGIGLRVAGRVASQRLNAETSSGAAAAVAPARGQAAASHADRQAAGRKAGRATAGVARGVGGFLRPFRRVGGILWLQVTGSLFFLFAFVAASFLWKNRADYAQGPSHRQFMASAAMMTVFLYLGVSSFWRARRR